MISRQIVQAVALIAVSYVGLKNGIPIPALLLLPRESVTT